jgi:SAM-dependent methyltransferase
LKASTAGHGSSPRIKHATGREAPGDGRLEHAALEAQPADRILEIGFGPGVAVAQLTHAGAGHVYGIDRSDVMLAQASRRNAGAIRAGRVTSINASVDRLPPALSDLDAVLAVDSLGFWPAAGERLVELRGLPVPGGRIAVTARPRSPGATAETAETARNAAAGIEDLLRSAGFERIRTEGLPLSPPAALGTAELVSCLRKEALERLTPGVVAVAGQRCGQRHHEVVPQHRQKAAAVAVREQFRDDVGHHVLRVGDPRGRVFGGGFFVAFGLERPAARTLAVLAALTHYAASVSPKDSKDSKESKGSGRQRG